MKKIILALLVLVLIIMPLTRNYDVNLDGKTNAMDLALINRHILGMTEFSSTQHARADANHDGLITQSDINIINAYVLNGGK